MLLQKGHLLRSGREEVFTGPAVPVRPLTAKQLAPIEEMTHAISHPNLLQWWALSILVALLFMLVVRRQPWIRNMLLMFSAIWFILIFSYVATFVISEHPRDLQFIDEVGWGYFVQLVIIAYLPWTLIRRFGKVKTKPYIRPAPSLADGLDLEQS